MNRLRYIILVHVPRPSLTAFFAAVEKAGLPSQLFLQPWKKAWVRPGSKHHVTLAIAFVTTRVHGFICTRDVFHVVHSGTLAALCSRDTRYSIVGEPDGSW